MYWFLFSLITIILAFLGESHPKHNIQLSLFFRGTLVVTLAYFISANAQIAADHFEYVAYYDSLQGERIKDFDFFVLRGTNSYEYGYSIVSIICNSIGLSFPGFSFIVLLFVNWVYVSFAYKHKYPILSIFFYILSLSFFQQANLFRQAIAIAIFTYGIHFIFERKWGRSLLSILFASLFHNSAVFLLPLCLLCFIKTNDGFIRRTKLALWGLLVFSLICFVLKLNIGISSLTLMDSLESYERYLTEDNIVGRSLGFDPTLNILSIFFLLSLRKENIWYSAFFVLGTIIGNFGYAMPTLVRFNLFLVTLEPVLYTSLFFESNYKDRVVQRIGLFVGILLVINNIRLLFGHMFTDGIDFGTKVYSFSEFFR